MHPGSPEALAVARLNINLMIRELGNNSSFPSASHRVNRDKSHAVDRCRRRQLPRAQLEHVPRETGCLPCFHRELFASFLQQQLHHCFSHSALLCSIVLSIHQNTLTMAAVLDGASEADLKRMATLWLYSDMSVSTD